jgi:hypothetical protein
MRRFVLLALVLAAVVTGCGDGRRSAASEPIRLVGDPGIKRDAPFLTWGSIVTIGDVPRPVLSASQAIAPPADLLPGESGVRKLRAQIPPDWSQIPWLVFETTLTKDGTTRMMRSWPVTGRVAGTSYEAYVTENKVGPGDTPGIRLWPVPDLASRDVETGNVTIPADAVLEVGLGLEPITWDTNVIPLVMTVTAIGDGRETVLSTTDVDVRRPEHKAWIDVQVPLGALAGRTVRLRFATRPKLGPTALCALPIWADPTIVVAPGTAAAAAP